MSDVDNAGGTVDDFNPLAPDPIAQLTALRTAGHRLLPSPRMGGAYLVLSYPDVEEVLRDHDTYSSAYALGGPIAQINPPEVVAELPDFLRGPVSGVVDTDLPDHRELRETLNRAYSGPRTNRLAPRIDQLAGELLDDLQKHEQFDLVAAYAVPFGQQAMAMVMGIPPGDVAAVAAWGEDMAALISPVTPVDDKIAAARRLGDYESWAEDFVEPRRAKPHDDAVGVYAYGDDGVRPLPHNDVLNCLLTHFVAGTVTTRNAITTTAYQLLRDGDLWALAVANPETYAAQALEEALRFAAPHRGLVRVTTRETELGGVALPAGSMLVPMLASANRDEHRFDAADQFKPDRQNARDHLAFGTGIHACVGAHLARQEARAAVSALPSRLPALRLAEPQRDPVYLVDFFFHGLAHLHVSP